MPWSALLILVCFSYCANRGSLVLQESPYLYGDLWKN
jgi:hypothetical protein